MEEIDLTNLTPLSVDGLAQDCSSSSTLAMEFLQSCVNSLRPNDAYMRR